MLQAPRLGGITGFLFWIKETLVLYFNHVLIKYKKQQQIPIISALYSSPLYTALQIYWPPEDMWSSLVSGLPAVAGTLLEKTGMVIKALEVTYTAQCKL